jgi:hypothetical protein
LRAFVMMMAWGNMLFRFVKWFGDFVAKPVIVVAWASTRLMIMAGVIGELHRRRARTHPFFLCATTSPSGWMYSNAWTRPISA